LGLVGDGHDPIYHDHSEFGATGITPGVLESQVFDSKASDLPLILYTGGRRR
jgi:hypothetical protein